MTAFLLHLMRHGVPEQPGCLHGHNDVALAPGAEIACLEQARLVEFDRLVTSDLARAGDCARAIGDERGMAPLVDPRWRELDFGAWNRCAPAEVDQPRLAAFWADPDASPPPGGESWSALCARVAVAIGALEPRSTLVVCHGGAMRAALGGLCGFSVAQGWAFDLPYAAMLSLRVWPGERPMAQIVGLWP